MNTSSSKSLPTGELDIGCCFTIKCVVSRVDRSERGERACVTGLGMYFHHTDRARQSGGNGEREREREGGKKFGSFKTRYVIHHNIFNIGFYSCIAHSF